MKRLFRTGLALAAPGIALLALDALARRRGAPTSNVVRKLLDVLRPAPVPDQTLEARVRNKLERIASEPGGMTVSIEHGCVDLRGAVATRERGRIVRAIATVRGVDSVLDLMTEPAPASAATLSAPTAARRVARSHAPWALRRAEWPLRARVVAAGSGLGLTLAGLGIGGLLAPPAAAVGLFLIARAASATSRPNAPF